jgi:Uncharacterized conserved protein
MATYLLFGKYSAEALKGISAKRSEDAKALFKKHGGELKAAYATLGGVDLLMIADLPDNARAMAASMALAKSTGIAFTTAPRSRWMSSTSSGAIATSSPGRALGCHGRACPGHPHPCCTSKDVDARHKAGHDGVGTEWAVVGLRYIIPLTR